MSTMATVTGEARSARDRLLAAADELFYREGIHSVGIDRVIEEAGVAKASLYKCFRSKDDLVAAYLDSRRRRVTGRIEAAVARHTDPREKILAVFDSQLESSARPGFNGCAFANATAENHSATVDEAAANYRRWFLDLFTGLARDAGASDPAQLGSQLRLLYDGMTYSARIDRDRRAAEQGRQVVALLLDSALPKKGRRRPDELRATLRKDLTAAMKARDSRIVTALRTAIAAIDNAEAVEAAHAPETVTSEHFAGAHAGLGVTEADRRRLDVDEVRGILRAQIAERENEADRYEALGQSDAAAGLRLEADALRRYLD